jgi:phenylalanyl-tRNA synthetase beta chain
VRHLFDRIAVQPLAVHPAVDRDMALVADETLTHGEIHALLQRAAPVELTRIELFDIFRGGTIAPGRKSMAYSLTYRSTQRTLTDEEVNALHDGLKDVLRRELGVDVREG